MLVWVRGWGQGNTSHPLQRRTFWTKTWNDYRKTCLHGNISHSPHNLGWIKVTNMESLSHARLSMAISSLNPTILDGRGFGYQPHFTDMVIAA